MSKAETHTWQTSFGKTVKADEQGAHVQREDGRWIGVAGTGVSNEVLRLATREAALSEALVDIINAHCSGAQSARDEAIERAQ